MKIHATSMQSLTLLKLRFKNEELKKHPLLLAKTKDGNNSYKLKNEIRQILYLIDQNNKKNKKNSVQQFNLIIVKMEKQPLLQTMLQTIHLK